MINNVKSLNRSFRKIFQKKYFILFTSLALCSSSYAKENKGSWCGWFFAGISTYLSSTYNSSQEQLHKEKEPNAEYELILSTYTFDIKQKDIHEKKQKEVILTQHTLEEAPLNNTELSITSPTIQYTKIDELLPKGKSCKDSRTCSLLSKITPYKVLKATFLTFATFSIPIAYAAQLQPNSYENHGVIGCAGCIGACCGLLGVPTPACIVFCATGPCSAVCISPTP